GGNVTGVPGDNGWFVSAVTVTAAASDATSGVVSLQYTLNGGAWTGYTGPLTLGNGVHSLQLQAMDAAGHIATAGETARVDTLSPALVLTGGGSFCPGCGDSLALNYSVSDGGSGVAGWQLTSGGVTLASGSGPVSAGLGWDGGGLPSGSGSLSLESRDLAGNTAQETLGFTIIVPTAIPPTAVVAPPASQQGGQAPVAVLPSGGQSPAATAPPLVQQATGAALAPGPTQPEPARPVVTVQFGNHTSLQTLVSSEAEAPGLASDNLFWGSAAAGLIGMWMAYALEMQLKRKKEEAAQAAEAARMNAQLRAQEKAYAEYQAWVRAQQVNLEADLQSIEERDPTWVREQHQQALVKSAHHRAALQAEREISMLDPVVVTERNNDAIIQSRQQIENMRRSLYPSYADEGERFTNRQDLLLARLYPGYQLWEADLLHDLLATGHADAEWTVKYILKHGVHFRQTNLTGSGAAWSVGNILLIDDPARRDAYFLSGIVHETEHLRQGPLFAMTVPGEVLGWQRGFKFYEELEGSRPYKIEREQNDALDLIMSTNPMSLMRPWNYRELARVRVAMMIYGTEGEEAYASGALLPYYDGTYGENQQMIVDHIRLAMDRLDLPSLVEKGVRQYADFLEYLYKLR
ncbi:MAG: hypothetical protein ABIJ39_08310, partial [Chloroflexota bacterium]